MTCDAGNPGSGLEQTQKCIHIRTSDKKNCTDWRPLKKTTQYHKNECQQKNMDSTMPTGSKNVRS